MSKIHFLSKPNKEVYLAFSGGVDSVVLLHTLIRRKYKVTLLTIDHGNEFAKQEVEFCKKVAQQYGIDYKLFNIPEFDKTTSLEAFWSKHRNNIFQRMDRQVCTGHHLDDNIETLVMTMCTGTPKLINLKNKNIIRPMIQVPKSTIIEYAAKYKLDFIEDVTNLDINYNLRNKVRGKLVPVLKECFPGIGTVVKKLTIKKVNNQDS